ncbi:Predicted arabinose efflux permease, MFS family [Methylobacillus rhizosphaerae]|uniref:Multidrug efflux pump Tap n=1 Tax=Methylobacillus rhizosphaerae TaxID=551994 RepID=A0A238ZBV3_9PROT|nr:MFS transporter [Methylobacillus rhizosphaerae]SNR80827.1 Predicted arabinose efflux permease, MFS family [Methylobacillus rhizosphaerae]
MPVDDSSYPLRNAAFLRLLAFRVSITFSYQVMAVVVGWHIFQITHDPLSLGLIGLAEVIPYFCTALFAGYAVDHYSRRMFGIMASIVLTINALVLVAISSGWLLHESESPLFIYGSIACVGFARAFIGPSYSALFALVLPRQQFARAASIGSAVLQTGLVLGPAIGGGMIAWLGISAAYGCSAVFALVAAVAMVSLKVRQPPATDNTPVFASIGQGLRFVFNNQIMLGAQALDMFAVLFGGAVAMLPMFIHDVYNHGPEGLGILRAAPALGAIATGIWLTRHPINRNAGRILLVAVAGFGLSIIAFALSGNFWLAAFLLMISGICDGVSVIVRSTIMQLVTPDEMRGRVSAINGIFIGSSNELGAFESGMAARLLGLVPSVIFGGAMTIAVVGAVAGFAPKLRKLSMRDLY